MGEWLLAAAFLFLTGFGFGARPDGRASAAPRTGGRPGADAG